MLKINLSDENDDSKKPDGMTLFNDEEIGVELNAAETESGTMEEPAGEVTETAKTSAGRKRTLVLLALLCVVSLAYFQKDTLFGLFTGKEEPVRQAAPPPPPTKEEPEPVPEPQEPDPTFVALNYISDAVPPRVWLSSMVVMHDGSYEIKGMAFTHDAIGALIGSLGKIGTVTSQDVPKKTKASDTVYTFTAAGKLSGIKVPEILDVIPADRLVPLADGVRGKSGDYGVAFLSLPKTGQTYMEKDMPFSLEGPYNGLKMVVADLCPEGGDTKIFRLVVTPAAPGRVFDKVRAAFSLRTVSAI